MTPRLPTPASVSRVTGRPVVVLERRSRTGSLWDFTIADDTHGWFMAGAETWALDSPQRHIPDCAVRFHRAIPAGWWRVKTLVEPGLVTTGLLRHARSVLAEKALALGFTPYGQLHTRWGSTLPAPYVVIELACTDPHGRRYAGEPVGHG